MILEGAEQYVITGDVFYNVYTKPKEGSKLLCQLGKGDTFSTASGTAVHAYDLDENSKRERSWHMIYPSNGGTGWIVYDNLQCITTREAHRLDTMALFDEMSRNLARNAEIVAILKDRCEYCD